MSRREEVVDELDRDRTLAEGRNADMGTGRDG